MTNDRTYLVSPDGSPVYLDDIGNLLRIVGLVVSGENDLTYALIVPNEVVQTPVIFYPTLEEWTLIIKRSDDPVWFEGRDLSKIANRKVLRQLSGAAQQRIWARDGFKCMYCHRPMGEIQLTIDHFVPLELGGIDDESNYISACRRCNKDKGMQHPREFLAKRKESYKSYLEYLSGFKKEKP